MKISAVGISLASILALLASGPAQSQQQDRRPGTTKPAPKPQPDRPGRPVRPGAGRPDRPTPLPGPVRPRPPKPNPGNGHRPRPPHHRPKPPIVKPMPPNWSGPHRPGWRPPHWRPIHRPPFHYPPGYHYRRWSVGQVLTGLFLADRYYFNDYNRFGLYRPPYPYRWVRYGPDLILVNSRNGRIYDVIYNAFY